MGRFVETIVAGLAVAGCSLLSLDEFSSGGPGASSPAGLADSAVADVTGSSLDGQPADLDAGPPQDDAGLKGTWCENFGSGAQVCDDFDRPGTQSGRWTKYDNYLAEGKVVEGAGTTGTSGAGGYRIRTQKDNASSVARLEYRTEMIAHEVDVQIDVRLDSIDPSANLSAPISITFDGAPPNGYRPIGLIMTGANVMANPTVFGANGAATSGGIPYDVVQLVRDKWTHLRLRALVDPPARIEVYVDGKRIVDRGIDGFAPAPFTVFAGVGWAASPNADVKLDIDNALVSWH